MQVVDQRTTLMHFHPHKDAARHFRKTIEQGGKRMEMAVAVGSDPAMCFAGVLPLPPDLDEVLFAGLIKHEGIKMVKCETVDLQVPANAEIVLEGYLDTSDIRTEGPFGDHTGFYSLEEKFPAFHITCITHRKKPVYHTIIVGPPLQEDGPIGYAIERLLLPVMKLHMPEIVDYYMPPEGCFNNLMIVSIKKQYPGHARKVMHAIWGLGQAMFTKCIVVVDHDVDVHNTAEVVWKSLTNIDPERDIEFVMGPLDILDHSSRGLCYGSKMGIDATKKLSDEGFTRRWPDVIKMSPEIKALVDKKWSDLGL
jgi:4-hydroxy-3-polyprenylbenzoate decarboxylase